MKLNEILIAPASENYDALKYSLVSVEELKRNPDFLHVVVKIHQEDDNPENDPHYDFDIPKEHSDWELHDAVREAIREYFEHESACYYGDSQY